MNELQLLLEQPDAVAESALWIVVRLAISASLGFVIAMLHRASRTGPMRNPGLFPTLILLSMLITLVTMAVGQNIAVAFTLVGTLAIVRFRTTVSDVRDTTFVIFSVATGIAAGQNLIVALTGVAMVTCVILSLRHQGTLSDLPTPRDRSPTSGTPGVVRVTIVPPDSDPSLYATAFERCGVDWRLTGSRIDRDRGRMQLTFVVSMQDAGRVPEVSTALLERPEVAEAVVELEGG